MFAAISPSEAIPATPPRIHGRAEVTFHRERDRSRLAHLYQSAPLRVLFPQDAGDDPPQAALVTTSGGVVGGDRLDYRLACGDGARAQFVAQAAEKIYRSTGADSRIDVVLAAGRDAWLEYLPQETILFEGARLRRRTRIDVLPGARVLAGEILVFGRTARGETVTRGLSRECWEIRRGGKLVWADAQHLDGDIAALLAAPAGFGGAIACATAILVCEAPEAFLPMVRESLSGRSAATIVNGILLVRWLGGDSLALRHDFAALWCRLRRDAAGLPEALPRLWHV